MPNYEVVNSFSSENSKEIPHYIDCSMQKKKKICKKIEILIPIKNKKNCIDNSIIVIYLAMKIT